MPDTEDDVPTPADVLELHNKIIGLYVPPEFQHSEEYSEAAELWVRGWSQYAIGQELGLTPEQVASEVRRLYAKLRKQAVADLDGADKNKLARYERIMREARAAWEASKRR